MVKSDLLGDLKKTWPEKFATEEEIFSHIHAGDKIFIGTGCGEPQYLVQALVNFVSSNPKAFFGIELIHVWTLGTAPYLDDKFRDNFRINSFFIIGSWVNVTENHCPNLMLRVDFLENLHLDAC